MWFSTDKYCGSCGREFKNTDRVFCQYCGTKLTEKRNNKIKSNTSCNKIIKSKTPRKKIPRKLRHQVFKRDGYRCRECGATNKQTRLHVDHIKPVSKGGTNHIDNLQTLCEECNLAKYTDEWVGGSMAESYNNTVREFDPSNIKPEKPPIEITYSEAKRVRLLKKWADLDEKLIYVKKCLPAAKTFDEELKYINQIKKLNEDIDKIILELSEIEEGNISLFTADFVDRL